MSGLETRQPMREGIDRGTGNLAAIRRSGFEDEMKTEPPLRRNYLEILPKREIPKKMKVS